MQRNTLDRECGTDSDSGFFQFHLAGLLLNIVHLTFLLVNDALLPPVHPVEIVTAPQLTRHEQEVEHRCGDLECDGPAVP